jgi:hypothetical protein
LFIQDLNLKGKVIKMAKKENSQELVTRCSNSITFTRRTKVTEENYSLIAAKMIERKMPCLTALQVEGNEGALRTILYNECVINEIPLIYIIEGAFRMKANDLKVTYYGSMACRLYNHYAVEQGLPKVIGVEKKYILNNLNTTLALQDFFGQISLKTF